MSVAKWIAGGVVLAAGLSCAAPRPQPAETPAARTDSSPDPRAEFLKRRLRLTDGQVAKLAEIYRADAEAQKRMKEERRGKIRQLLTDEQKKSFDELVRKLEPTPEERRERIVDRLVAGLRKGLDLSEEQAGKIRPILKEACGKAADRMKALCEKRGEGVDWRRELKKAGAELLKVALQVREHLDDAQREKFDRFLKRHLGRLLKQLPQDRKK